MRESNKDNHNAVKSSASLMQNPHIRRIAFYAGVLLITFLLGFVPMWLKLREEAKERSAAESALRVSRLQNALATAAIDARRGEYEPARQAASEFFTNLRDEIERVKDSAYTPAQQENMRVLLANRDETITMLARGDPASAERLAEMYAAYRRDGGGSVPIQQPIR